MPDTSVTLVVLGDVGRSPRMQYHALSLARHGTRVRIVGYGGSPPLAALTSNALVSVHTLPAPSPRSPRTPYLAHALYRAVSQTLQLVLLLAWTLPAPDFYLVQNPPAVPTLAVLRLVLAVVHRRARLVVDWHNFGYSIMALSLPREGAIVRGAAWYERVFGRTAHAHFCVTAAMQRFLRDEWRVRDPIHVLYDRAPSQFRRLSQQEREHFRKDRLGINNSTALLVSSTSWTADEDFSILLDALKLYDRDPRSPPVLAVVTGKGPLKQHYEQLISTLALSKVQIRTMWLANDEYPRILGAADVGVSLHTSSSGLDLPMKIVDMFGCGLPVCAVGYSTLSQELVQEGKNGHTFSTPRELADLLGKLLRYTSELERLRRGVSAFQKVRWDDSWDATAWRKVFSSSSIIPKQDYTAGSQQSERPDQQLRAAVHSPRKVPVDAAPDDAAVHARRPRIEPQREQRGDRLVVAARRRDLCDVPVRCDDVSPAKENAIRVARDALGRVLIILSLNLVLVRRRKVNLLLEKLQSRELRRELVVLEQRAGVAARRERRNKLAKLFGLHARAIFQQSSLVETVVEVPEKHHIVDICRVRPLPARQERYQVLEYVRDLAVPRAAVPRALVRGEVAVEQRERRGAPVLFALDLECSRHGALVRERAKDARADRRDRGRAHLERARALEHDQHPSERLRLDNSLVRAS